MAGNEGHDVGLGQRGESGGASLWQHAKMPQRSAEPESVSVRLAWVTRHPGLIDHRAFVERWPDGTQRARMLPELEAIMLGRLWGAERSRVQLEAALQQALAGFERMPWARVLACHAFRGRYRGPKIEPEKDEGAQTAGLRFT